MKALPQLLEHRHSLSRLLCAGLSTARKTCGVPSFVFDIDGVLLRGGTVLPAGRRALEALHPGGRRAYPLAFLTNGGGFSEAERATHLQNMLGVTVEARDVVVAHTPMRGFVEKYNARKDCSVVVVGKGRCKEVAKEYGFERVIAIEEMGAVHHHATPFVDYEHLGEVSPEWHALAQAQVCAVFVMTDSNNWGRDIQLLADIAMSSNGRVAHSGEADHGHKVDFYFSNPDLLFPNEFGRPRLAGGAMRVALETLMREVHGRNLTFAQFGKPHTPQYRLVEKILAAQAADMGFHLFESNQPIYAIGDNPQSDVQGANRAGHPWVSVLVRTGNFTGDNNDPVYPAKLVMNDAHAAVEHVINTKEKGSSGEANFGM